MCEQLSSHSTAEIMELVSRNLGHKNQALAVRRVGRGDEARRGSGDGNIHHARLGK